MRPLSAEDEATLRAIAERHGFYAARGPHTGEGSASRLIDALLAGEVVTLALTPADRGRLVAWLDEAVPPEGRLATVLHSVATQLRPTLPKAARAAAPRAPTVNAATPPQRVAAISRPTRPPAAWTSAPPACRSWPVPARSDARLTAAGRSRSAKSRVCRANVSGRRSDSPSQRNQSENVPRAAGGPPPALAPGG